MFNFLREFRHALIYSISLQERTYEVLYKMSTSAVTRDQFNAGLDALIAAEAARDAAVTAALNDLIAKVGAGTVTPEDFSAELSKVASLQTAAASITAQATADDPGPTTVTPATPDTPAA